VPVLSGCLRGEWRQEAELLNALRTSVADVDVANSVKDEAPREEDLTVAGSAGTEARQEASVGSEDQDLVICS
jgi:hypothetical protein